MQNIDFIGYHIRRTTVTVFLHLSLPFVYCLGLSVVDPDLSLVSGSSPSHSHTLHTLHTNTPTQLSSEPSPLFLCLLWVLSLSSLLLGVGVALHWSREGWRRHPLVSQLTQLQQPWRYQSLLCNLGLFQP